MKIMIGPRRSGRTRYLINQSAYTGGYIVCGSSQEAHAIFHEMGGKELYIPYPITYDQFLSLKFHDPDIKSFLIDDVDRLLRYVAGPVKIEAITIHNGE